MRSSLVQANVPGGFVAVERVAFGQKIEKPGIYDIPMGWYHADCCVGPSISSSGLREIYRRSPKHYWAKSYLNPKAEEEKEDAEARALRIGKAAHTLMLEPHLFESTYTTRPPMFHDWRTKAAREWRADAQMEGFNVLEPSDMQAVHGVRRALVEHPLYQQGLLDGEIERSLVWLDEKSGVWLKARPDAIPVGSNVLADLKCTNDCRADSVDRKIYDMGYDMQLALAAVGMQEVLRREIEDHVLVMVEYDSPHGVRIATLPHTEIERARSLLRFSLNRFVACMEAGEWPSYDLDDAAYSYRSQFRSKLIDAEISSGRFPKEF